MTVREVLKADWNVDGIQVDIIIGGRRVTCYHVGAKVEPGKYWRYDHETKAGDVYKDGKIKQVLVRRVIQNYGWSGAKPSQVGCVGVLIDQIPRELVDLEVTEMMPEWGIHRHGSDMHGYIFTAEPDMIVWSGIKGEDEIVKEGGNNVE